MPITYTHTNNTGWNRYIGRAPLPWLVSEETNHKKVIDEFFQDKIRVWDADICGEETIDFLFDDGKAFRLEYSWWIEPNSDDWLHDHVEVHEIDAKEANVPTKINRDFLVL